jgi:hypothetical protein
MAAAVWHQVSGKTVHQTVHQASAELGSIGSRRTAGGGAFGPSPWQRGAASIAARPAAAPLTPAGLRGAGHELAPAAPPPAAR